MRLLHALAFALGALLFFVLAAMLNHAHIPQWFIDGAVLVGMFSGFCAVAFWFDLSHD
jgi:RsiW-degrading membrane proteinase PrsW (M82 family)